MADKTIIAHIVNLRAPQVLYEDNHVIAVYKPGGMLTQSDITGDPDLLSWVKNYLKTTYQKPGNVFVGLLHRLDRPVAGIVLFAKTSKGGARLSEQIRNHTVQKIYQALIKGVLNGSGTLKNYLLKHERNNRVSVYDEPVLHALYAELEYRAIAHMEEATIVKIELKTGRSHQIRSQLAHVNHPIIGDVKYGGPAWTQPNMIALCATEFSFRTATGAESVHILLENGLDWQRSF